VTGSTGFVALNIVDELLRRDWQVFCLHRPGSKRAKLLKELPHAATCSLVCVEGSLSVAPDEFAKLVPESTQVIFHICHLEEGTRHPSRLLSAPGFQPEGAEEHKRVNKEAMANVIHAAALRKVRRIVYCSSWSSYGRMPDGSFVTEASESRAYDVVNAKCCCSCCCCSGSASSPVPYFQCKLELEGQLRLAQKQGLVRQVVIMQPCSIFGEWFERYRLREMVVRPPPTLTTTPPLPPI
jgi:nucleoside-diphosphate-sugar epimerase